MIYKLDDGIGFVISSQGTWLPGVYDTEKTARYAFRLTNQELEDLSKELRVLTKDDITLTIKNRKLRKA